MGCFLYYILGPIYCPTKTGVPIRVVRTYYSKCVNVINERVFNNLILEFSLLLLLLSVEVSLQSTNGNDDTEIRSRMTSVVVGSNLNLSKA